MHTVNYEFIMKLAECHQTLSSLVRSGNETNDLPIDNMYGCQVLFNSRPVGRGGSRGFVRTPLLASKRFYMYRLTVHFECPTVRNWFSSFHAIETHRRPKKFVHGGPARNPRVSCLRRCNERTHVNTRINKSLF